METGGERPTGQTGPSDRYAGAADTSGPRPEVPANQQQYGAAPPSVGNPEATAALTLGILSIPGAFIAIVGLILGILAVIFGLKGTKKVDRGETAQNRGRAQLGLYLGIAGIVLSVASAVVGVVSVT